MRNIVIVAKVAMSRTTAHTIATMNRTTCFEAVLCAAAGVTVTKL